MMGGDELEGNCSELTSPTAVENAQDDDDDMCIVRVQFRIVVLNTGSEDAVIRSLPRMVKGGMAPPPQAYSLSSGIGDNGNGNALAKRNSGLNTNGPDNALHFTSESTRTKFGFEDVK